MGIIAENTEIPENSDNVIYTEKGSSCLPDEVIAYGVLVWKKQKYYWIVYNANGGVGTMEKQTMPVGVDVPLDILGYSRTGYLFSGWSRDLENVHYSDRQTVRDIAEAGQTLNLYALWVAITYYVDYDGNNATGGNTARSTHRYDTYQTLTPNGYYKTGYAFSGWAANDGTTKYDDGHNIINLTATHEGVVTLYASWSPISYYVMYNGNGADAGETPASTHVYGVSSALTANGYTRSYYLFLGWSNDAGSTVKYRNKEMVTDLAVTSGATTTLYAVWKPTAISNRSDGCLPVTGGICMGSSAGEYRDNAFWEGAGKFGWGYCPAEDSRIYWISTKSPVDLTNVSKIIFNFDTGSHCRLVCGASTVSGLDGYTAEFSDEHHKSGERTIEVDVSGLTGSYYVKSQAVAYFSGGYASHFTWNYVTLQ